MDSRCVMEGRGLLLLRPSDTLAQVALLKAIGSMKNDGYGRAIPCATTTCTKNKAQSSKSRLCQQ